VIVLGKWVHYHHPHGSPQACYEHTYSEIDAARYVFIWDGRTWYRDGPGGRVTGTVERRSDISATISVGATISIGFLVADSQVTVSAAVTRTASITTGHSYFHDIPARRFGNIEYGAWGYQVDWSQWREDRGCRFTELAAGTGMVPTVAVGWFYWTG
jgi:hypothetical protein